jgi:hypothetical protein
MGACVTAAVISYGEYANALKALGDEGRQALKDLDDTHDEIRKATKDLLIAKGKAYSHPDVLEAKAAGERDALVGQLTANEKATLKYHELRAEAINAALREIRSRRSSGDELARCARASVGPGGMDTPGPDLAPLLRSAA